MFTFSKIFLILADPGVVVPAVLSLGSILLLTRWRKAGTWLVGLSTAVILVLSVLPVGDFMIARLENRFPVVHQLPKPFDGIIVLGGTINQFMTRARGQPALSDGAERLTEFVALARAHPDARLVFTGGSGALTRQDVKEAEAARLFFAQMGLDTKRVVFESRSRNTFENAVYTKELVKPEPGERWVLITSAMHMPRAVGTFRKAGWSTIPYPVDYRTNWPVAYSLGFHLTSGLAAFQTGLREWMGLAAYRMMGRTDELFPAASIGADKG